MRGLPAFRALFYHQGAQAQSHVKVKLRDLVASL
jgi:hypothetical protein